MSCNFANPLTVFVCEVCNASRNDEANEEDGDIGETIAYAPWFTTDALQVPFRPLIEMISSCEDQRGGGSQGGGRAWSDRDMFVDLSRTNNGQLAFAVCVFFNFGRVVSMTTDKQWSQGIQSIWDANKEKVVLRKKSTASSPSKAKKMNKNKKGSRKKRKKKSAVSMYCQVSNWLEFTKYDQMGVGLLNLTSIPGVGYLKYPIESKKWRPTLQEALSVMEERLIECELNSYLVVVTLVESGVVALMGWVKIEDIGYVRNGCRVVMELFVRDDGEEVGEEEEVAHLMQLNAANFE